VILPEAEHWKRIETDGEKRVAVGHRLRGTKTVKLAVYRLLRHGYEEWIDEGNYTYGWALEKLGPGPEGQERIYVTGPIEGNSEAIVERNIIGIESAYRRLVAVGHWPYCPYIGLSPDMVFYESPDRRNMRIQLGMVWMDLCHSILLLPGYKDSKYTMDEHDRAKELGLNVYYSIEDIPEVERRGDSA